MSKINRNLGRIRWKCRRGMLELDLMLLPFFDNHFQSLSDEEQAIFERLLDEEDPDIHAWLMNQAVPEDPELLSMIHMIKQFT